MNYCQNILWECTLCMHACIHTWSLCTQLRECTLYIHFAKCTLLAISNSLICIFFSCGQTAHTIEGLVKLEAKYGPLIGFSPAVDDVLDYLQSVRAYL